jgi:hypothetical protein
MECIARGDLLGLRRSDLVIPHERNAKRFALLRKPLYDCRLRSHTCAFDLHGGLHEGG